MPLLENPVMIKFFTNKIESSQLEWRAYLLQVADITSTFDGEVYDRSIIEERFEAISGRSIDCGRDTSNYRDEFGAYGSYLGVFHIRYIAGQWRVLLSNLARQFLCSTEPDVSSFCTLQLALFQYPNGMGYALQRNGTLRMQYNIKKNTMNEIEHNLRLAPFRLICRTIVAMHKFGHVPLDDIEISYKTIFKLFNDDSINTTYNPQLDLIYRTICEYRTQEDPAWITPSVLSKFKRNFHILEQTGLIKRSSDGLKLSDEGILSFKKIELIAEIEISFRGFEPLYGTSTDQFDEAEFMRIVSSQAWDQYYDGANLPLYVIQKIAGHLGSESIFEIDDITNPQVAFSEEVTFPSLSGYVPHERAQYTLHPSRPVDLQSAIILREKANCEHERILQNLNANLRLLGVFPCNNIFIDLYADIQNESFIFEVKTTSASNYISQIRKGLSQLYEYRYRLNKPNALLCLVLQNKPRDSWLIDYLVIDRSIAVFWLVDEVRFECPRSCSETLAAFSTFVHPEHIE